MVEIRAAREDEVRYLTALALRSKAHWGYDDAFMQTAASELTVDEGNVSRTWVADHDGRAVGVLTLAYAGKLVEVDLLFVEPDAIGTGVGRALWDHAVMTARTKGSRALIVQSDPNAEKFYLRMGAVRTGEAPSPSTGRSLPVLELAL